MIAHGLIAVALGASSLSSPRQADNGEISIAVSVKGLDLDSDEGKRRLRTRLSMAVSRVCGHDARTAAGYAWVKHCRRVAEQSAEEQLAAVLNGHRGNSKVLATLP